MLKYDWALVNLHIDNLILLRNGWNNTRFLCIKVDLRVLSGSRRLQLPAAVQDVRMPDAGVAQVDQNFIKDSATSATSF